MNTEEVGELVQRWNDLQAGAAADAELLRGDSQAATTRCFAAPRYRLRRGMVKAMR